LKGERWDDLKANIRSFRWPPTQGDGSGWQREAFLKEVERIAYED